MSDLIVLPGTTIFEGPLSGRVLMLDTSKQPRFQCFGFAVTRNSPIQTVPHNAQEGPLRAALDAKVLIDITGTEQAAGSYGKMLSEIDNAIKSKTLTMSEGEDIGARIIMGTDSKGQSYIITPKDEADYQRMQEEIRTTGTLRVEKPKVKDPQHGMQTPGLSAIFMEDLPDQLPTGE
jgi:hypothetical protein